MTMSEFPAFAEMERSSWSDATRASGYVQLFASAPDQAIESLLDAAGADRGLKALDLCCGQGNVSEAMLSRGCQVVGCGFFAGNAGVRAATGAKRQPSLKRTRRSLPLSTPNLIIVVSEFGRVPCPGSASRAGGGAARSSFRAEEFAMTVWCGPESSPLLCELCTAAIKTHGRPTTSAAPPGPDFHQFARRGRG